jgi:hypothetical protein
MVRIIELIFDGDSSRGGTCSVHGIEMIQRATTAAGGCGERRRTSPRRLPLDYNWSTYNPMQSTPLARHPNGITINIISHKKDV